MIGFIILFTIFFIIFLLIFIIDSKQEKTLKEKEGSAVENKIGIFKKIGTFLLNAFSLLVVCSVCAGVFSFIFWSILSLVATHDESKLVLLETIPIEKMDILPGAAGEYYQLDDKLNSGTLSYVTYTENGYLLNHEKVCSENLYIDIGKEAKIEKYGEFVGTDFPPILYKLSFYSKNGKQVGDLTYKIIVPKE